MPLVSVVIPVYKGANYVAQAIESALNQTYKNIEVIVVDDGSPDDGATRRAVEPYIPRVRYIYQENGGVAAALNTGARNMKGEIFSWLSHDDLFVSEKTAQQVEFLRNLGGGDVILYSDYMIVDPDNNHQYDVVLNREMLTKQPLLAILRGATNGCTMLLPRKVFETVGYFDENLRYTQDYDFWDRAEDHFPLVHCPGIFVRQRVHPNQDSRRPESLVECNALWLRLADNRDDIKKSRIEGSPKRFLEGLRGFLLQTPYEGAIGGLEERLRNVSDQTLVSIVVDVPPEGDGSLFVRNNILNQKHKNIEVILVNRGSQECEFDFGSIGSSFCDVRVIKGGGIGIGDGRNLGAESARGTYIVFANTADLFLPNHVSALVALMQDSGALVSTSSLFVSCPELGRGYALVPSVSADDLGPLTARARWPFWLSAMMFNRLLFIDGLQFGGDGPHHFVEMVIECLERTSIVGADEVGVMIQLGVADAPLSATSALRSAASLLVELDSDPRHGHESELSQALRARYNYLADAVRARRGGQKTGDVVNWDLVGKIFDSPSAEVMFDVFGQFE